MLHNNKELELVKSLGEAVRPRDKSQLFCDMKTLRIALPQKIYGPQIIVQTAHIPREGLLLGNKPLSLRRPVGPPLGCRFPVSAQGICSGQGPMMPCGSTETCR